MTVSDLVTAVPSEQKQMISNRLFLKVYEFQPIMAGRITNILLEINNTEFMFHMLENHELLKAKVGEAVQVLQTNPAKEAKTQANAGQ